MPKSSFRGLTILVTARDPGSAHQAAAFVRAIRRRHSDCTLHVVADGSAVPILEATGNRVRRWPHGPAASPRAQLATARRLLAVLRPDVLLVGLAFPGYGPDEALFDGARRTGIPTACIQDYWGYVGGFRKGAAPQIFFVQDELAAKLTRKKLGRKTEIVVTGSPRHLAARRRISVPPRRESRRRRLVFVGQPLGFSGCRENLEHFIWALAQLKSPHGIIFRRHPNDPLPDAHYERLFANQPHPVTIHASSRPWQRPLLEADLVVTCFSSVGLDFHYLQLSSRALLAPVLFVTIGSLMRRFLKQQVGLTTVPNVALKMAVGVTSRRALVAALKRLPRNRVAARRYRERITAVLAPRLDPCEAIYALLMARA